ncbi:histidinol-phosphatase HisJ family protein [Ethanoligenens harbinense]|uniref:Histidinol-phosphatase n=1 Tax=Ethanoligenens harbinense (strain DSM 18485 / JCM 12961 / CGMCC 1.5033 / YUAN-3) TaxID=663278 RepID=E6U357_ETHHY|nr:histidinol-phosphatase HisJ family protein [Ethanoligenens harbinense]ADU27529.1 histidinol phosphate phosphatase HisJ family [Ethanoligenens harbinense YUAN-3]
MRTDLHIHTDNSPDAEHSTTEICISAIEKGIGIIAVTDHCEIDRYEVDGYDRSVRQSFFDVLKARKVFEDRLEILQGIELGNVMYDTKLAHDVIRAHPYDFVLGSLHHIKGVDDFAFLDYEEQDPEALLAAYYEEMEHMVEWGEFDVLAHLTYPLRYINGEQKKNVDVRKFEGQITRVLRKAIEKGIGLELNTSGLRQAYGMTMPDIWGLSLYRSLGGTILTIGSDAHTLQDVGSHVDEGMRLAVQAGFPHICVFRARQPFEISIT